MSSTEGSVREEVHYGEEDPQENSRTVDDDTEYDERNSGQDARERISSRTSAGTADSGAEAMSADDGEWMVWNEQEGPGDHGLAHGRDKDLEYSGEWSWTAEEEAEEEAEVGGEGEQEPDPVLLVKVGEASLGSTHRTSEPKSGTCDQPTLPLPFKLKWAFGCKKKAGLVNLTTRDRFQVMLVASHMGVVYDYRHHTMVHLPGHNFPITSTASDASGRWLVTADAGQDTAIIVWDNDRRLPVWSTYNAFPMQGARRVQMSPDARFLTAVSWSYQPVLKFWMWTLGNDEADAVTEVNPAHGTIKHIAFHHKYTHLFAVTAAAGVIFCSWQQHTKLLTTHEAVVKKHKGRLGCFEETVFLDDQLAITSTSLGQVVVWCDSATAGSNNTAVKTYLKTIQLANSKINNMTLVDGMVATCCENGVVMFHDQDLKLMFSLPQFHNDPLVSISFNQEPRCEQRIHPFHPEFDEACSSKRHTCEEELEVCAGEEWSNIVEKDALGRDEQLVDELVEEANALGRDEQLVDELIDIVATDCTLQRQQFHVRDFVFLTKSGRLGYACHVQAKIRYFLYPCEAPVLSIDCNPRTSYLSAGNAVGRLALYNTETKELLLSVQLADCSVTSLKYSPRGDTLLAGLHSGDIVVLDPLVLHVRDRLQHTTAPILKFCFDPSGSLFAHSTDKFGVCLYAQRSDHEWCFMGKYSSHYKPICDIMFESDPRDPTAPRLFSLGTDRMLVEYDTRNLQEGQLSILTRHRIEQTAVPLCFECDPTCAGRILMANNEYKLKQVEVTANNCCCWKTTLGPVVDTPVRYMRTLQRQDVDTETFMVYATTRTLGLRILPPTGNPFEDMALCAHPQRIQQVAVDYDATHAFTIGQDDCAILMWQLNTHAVEVAFHLGGKGLDPYLSLVEGGPGGSLMQEIKDYFYYMQIVNQSHSADRGRYVSNTIALNEVPNLLRVLGFFPTDYEICNVLNELQQQDSGSSEVQFEEFVKTYLNHRPVAGISHETLLRSLVTVAGHARHSELDDDDDDKVLKWERLVTALEEGGEIMKSAELLSCLEVLLSTDHNQSLPSGFTAQQFVSQVLGADISTSTQDKCLQATSLVSKYINLV